MSKPDSPPVQLYAAALRTIVEFGARTLDHLQGNVAQWALHSSSFRLGQASFVALTVENSLDLLRRALGSPRNSDHRLVLDGLNRETPKLLYLHRQPAEPLRAGTQRGDRYDLDGDLVDAGTEPAQGKTGPPRIFSRTTSSIELVRLETVPSRLSFRKRPPADQPSAVTYTANVWN